MTIKQTQKMNKKSNFIAFIAVFCMLLFLLGVALGYLSINQKNDAEVCVPRIVGVYVPLEQKESAIVIVLDKNNEKQKALANQIIKILPQTTSQLNITKEA